MQKEYSCIGFFVVMCAVIMSCKSHSYGSSQTLSQNGSESQLVIEDEDCFAWRFYLFTSMYSIVHQGSLWIVSDIKKKYTNDIHSAIKTRYIDMNKVLPPKTAQKIMDTIIEKEGGHCSREVLYEITPCAYEYVHREGDQRIGGFVYAGDAHGEVDFNHFSESLGVPMNKDLISDYRDFLREHLSKSPNTRYSTPRMSCVDGCDDDLFLLGHKNGLGRCMFEKYRTYFKENDIFDFGEFFYWERYLNNPELHIPSMEAYIKETNRIADEYEKNKK